MAVPWFGSGSFIDGEADGAHELEGVAGSDDAGLDFVVEDEAAIVEGVFEVEVGSAIPEFSGYVGERQVVRADDADGILLKQAADDEFAAGETIVAVGAGEKFVEQKQDRFRSGAEVEDELDAVDFCVEAGNAAGERVENADGRGDLEGRDAQIRGTDRRAALGEHGIDADAANEGAFAGHVGTAED